MTELITFAMIVACIIGLVEGAAYLLGDDDE